MNIEATKRVTAAVVGSDLAECGSRVRSAWSDGDKTLFVTSGALIGFGVAAPDTMNRLAQVYSACMTPSSHEHPRRDRGGAGARLDTPATILDRIRFTGARLDGACTRAHTRRVFYMWERWERD